MDDTAFIIKRACKTFTSRLDWQHTAKFWATRKLLRRWICAPVNRRHVLRIH